MNCCRTHPRDFLVSESGAVTLDWVVLTAAIVSIGLGVVTILISGTAPVGQSVQTSLETGAATLELSFD